MTIELTILGSSSATPTLNRFPSSQYINMLDHHIMIDCGEGTQMQMQRYKIKKSKLRHIFISHVHADHILGLPGLIFSMNLLQRTEPLHIYGPKELFEILDLFIKHSDTTLHFELVYHVTQNQEEELLFEDTLIKISSFPLYHRVPTTGFLFREQNRLKKLNKDVCEKLHIPFTYYGDLKRGKDFITPEGKVIPNEDLTYLPGDPVSYAYCSDTRFNPKVADVVTGVDLLYHEATFMHDKLTRAEETMHTTALEAGKIATMAGAKRLLIGHFSSRYDVLYDLLNEARSEFANTELAEEGKHFFVD